MKLYLQVEIEVDDEEGPNPYQIMSDQNILLWVVGDMVPAFVNRVARQPF